MRLSFQILVLLSLSAAGCAEEVAAPPAASPEVVVAAPSETVMVGQPRQPVVPQTQSVIVSDGLLETWASRNPSAAKALGTWAHNNPEAASNVFSYDLHRPGRSRDLVHWAIAHPGEDISVFTSKHPGWSWFDRVMAAHHLGADQFLQWCRQYPGAVEELVQRPSGLRWVGDHLFASEWRQVEDR
jgi:hypothetical protein